MENVTRDLNDRHFAEVQKHTETEQALRQRVKVEQRETDKLKNELKTLHHTFEIKESGVKSDVERLYNEWQEKLDFTEEELQKAESRIIAAEADKKSLSKQVLDLKKQARTVSLEVSDLKA